MEELLSSEDTRLISLLKGQDDQIQAASIPPLYNYKADVDKEVKEEKIYDIETVYKNIDKSLETIQQKVNNFQKDDLIKLSQDSDFIQDQLSTLQNMLKIAIQDKKEKQAEKAVTLLIKQGFSFSNINIDGIQFQIHDKEFIKIS